MVIAVTFTLLPFLRWRCDSPNKVGGEGQLPNHVALLAQRITPQITQRAVGGAGKGSMQGGEGRSSAT